MILYFHPNYAVCGLLTPLFWSQDTRDALTLKLDLYPPESSLIAEAHFKLSLALEFASVTTASSEENKTDATESQPAQVDEKMRTEAASEMD